MPAHIYTSRESWLAARGIGGSDAADALDAYPKDKDWAKDCGPDRLLRRLTTGERDPDNARMMRGRIFESAIARMWAEKYAAKLVAPAVVAGGKAGVRICDAGIVETTNWVMWSHPEQSFVTATPDYFAQIGDELVLIECKSTGGFQLKGWLKNGIPRYYHMQIQHQLGVLRDNGIPVNRGLLVADFGNDENGGVYDWTVTFDAGLWRIAKPLYAELWGRAQQARKELVA
jgi:hypothetical protein